MKEFWRANKFWLIVFAIVVVGLAVDLITKAVFYQKHITLIEGVLSIFYTQNFGAGWSILSGQTVLLIIFTALILIGVTVFNIFYKNKSNFYSITMGLLYAGGLGNLIDRIFFGFVRDFISLDFISFPIFNFADIFLTFGAICIVVYLLFFAGKKKKDKSKN